MFREHKHIYLDNAAIIRTDNKLTISSVQFTLKVDLPTVCPGHNYIPTDNYSKYCTGCVNEVFRVVFYIFFHILYLI